LRRRVALSWSAGCLLALAAAAVAMCSEAKAGAECTARSTAFVTPVVELYTSEGCSSCPPADRWLSSLKGRGDVVALAYHVDYWDRLGWKDRFASALFTQRQYEQLRVNGSRFAYTPQVVVAGQDRKDWPRLKLELEREASPVSIELKRSRDASGERVLATVSVVNDSHPRLAAYWAVTESDHRTTVKAGENEGATLAHDFVVRDHEAVAAWSAVRGEARQLVHSIRLPVDAGHARRVSLVVTDAVSGKPLQALGMDCL
jgi:hypothetical protein